jgi:Flp pilus assembly secretin CpaC
MVQLQVSWTNSVPNPTQNQPSQMPRVLSLVTVSGQPAEMLLGGEQAVPTDAGSVQFVDVGNSLSFLPIVLGNGAIFLQIDTSQSVLNEALGVEVPGGQVAGHNVERVQTTVELQDGQSLILAQNDSGTFSVQVTAHVISVPGEPSMVQLQVSWVNSLPQFMADQQSQTRQVFSVTGLSGRTSELLIGGEQAVLQGNGVQFVAVGTQLSWLPIILGTGLIHQAITLDVGFPSDAQDDTLPAEHVQTTVDLADGQSMIIAQDPSANFSVTITPHLIGQMVTLDLVVIGPSSNQNQNS